MIERTLPSRQKIVLTHVSRKCFKRLRQKSYSLCIVHLDDFVDFDFLLLYIVDSGMYVPLMMLLSRGGDDKCS